MFNHAPSGAGGGIYNDVDSVTLACTMVRFNTVNNCSPALSVPAARRPEPSTG